MPTNKPLLVVPENATEAQIKKAYYNAALKHHPDKGGKEEDFKKLSDEYEIALDRAKNKTSKPAASSNNFFPNPLKSDNEQKYKEVITIVERPKFSVKTADFDSFGDLLQFISKGSKNCFGFSTKTSKVNDQKSHVSESGRRVTVTYLGLHKEKIVSKEPVSSKNNKEFEKIGSSSTFSTPRLTIGQGR